MFALVWVVAASVLGFAIAALFAGVLGWRRNLYLVVYVPVAITMLALFTVSAEIDLAHVFLHHWGWGVCGAVASGAFVVGNVLSQAATPRREGASLVLDVVWPGLTYGVVDALLLSVMPILAVRETWSGADWATSTLGQFGVGAIALLASCLVAAAYHWGYPEFRGKRVLLPVFGNAVMSLAYLLTGNPLAAVLSHAALHVAAIVHGRETTIQLPPHYGIDG